MATLLPIPVGFVELKVSFRDPAPVREAFDLTRKPDQRRTLSFLDVRDPHGDPRLLGAHVVLRLRQKADGSGDTTVKLRPPADPTLLTGRWDPFQDLDDDYKVEGDWARNPVLSASQDAGAHKHDLAAVITKPADPEPAFSDVQRAFLAACAPGLADPFRGLRVAGPIETARWDVGDTGPFSGDLALRAERWRYAGPAEFMELSARVPYAKAERLHDRLLAECADRGLEREDGATTKTETVLRDLLP